MKNQNLGKNNSEIIYDVDIIGAGIIGSSTARELCKFDLKIILLERE